MKAPTYQQRTTKELETMLRRADMVLSIYEDNGMKLPKELAEHHDNIVAELDRRALDPEEIAFEEARQDGYDSDIIHDYEAIAEEEL